MAQIQFKGKTFVQNHHLLVKYHELVPIKKKSLTDKISLRDNLIIHGDNLKAVKALLPIYAGKIKCIYIDPPYNTGNENWIYNDNVNSPMMQDWLGKVVDREDLTRHDKWLCMMMPRLKLLRELLREDGMIFISIDDNEVHHLRGLLDDVFGEKNFVANFIWNTEGHTDNQYNIKINHEYIFVYIKNESYKNNAIGYIIDPNTRKASNLWKGYAENSITKNGPGNPPSEVILPKNFPCEVKYLELDKSNIPQAFFIEVSKLGYISRALTTKYNIQYPIRRDKLIIKNNKLLNDCKVFSGWANVNKLKSFIENDLKPVEEENGKYYFYLSNKGVIYYKKEKNEVRNILSVLRNLGTTEKNRYILEELGITYQYPKPFELIKYIIKVGSTSSYDIILDTFAGSGTTAHAVLAINKEDGGNRKFILVECEDYADSISAERVRRVIKGVPSAKNENLKKGLGGTFSFFELGKPIELESILDGSHLPSYKELARYVFYTATGEEFDEKAIDRKRNFIGESKNYEVFLFYELDITILKNLALTLDKAEKLGPVKADKKRLVFAPTKYLDQEYLDKYKIDFAQLPFEIYKLAD